VKVMALLGLLVAALVVVAPGSTSSLSTRATTDQPDDISGPQVHIVYAIPSNGTDRGIDTNGTIAASVNNWETWLRGQTGGHGLRLDTYHGTVDITFFRLTENDAQAQAQGGFVRDEIEKELKAAGLTKPDKIYGVYYDGQTTSSCGGGAYPPVLPGIVGAIYMPSTFWNTVGDPCYHPEESLAGMSLMDYALLHELMHTMGFVPSCAPHQTLSGHVSDSPTDLMYAGSQDWHPSVLDIGHNDYFDAHIPGCPDLADSNYLEGNDPYALTVSVSGSGSVSSNPDGITCGSTCTASFDRGSEVSLTANPSAGSRFVGWSGACSGANASCTVTLKAAASVTATFGAAAKPPAKKTPKCKKGQKSTKRRPCHR
jgi:hypothetical protein